MELPRTGWSGSIPGRTRNRCKYPTPGRARMHAIVSIPSLTLCPVQTYSPGYHSKASMQDRLASPIFKAFAGEKNPKSSAAVRLPLNTPPGIELEILPNCCRFFDTSRSMPVCNSFEFNRFRWLYASGTATDSYINRQNESSAEIRPARGGHRGGDIGGT